MRVMVMIRATEANEAGELPTAEMMKGMGNYNEELVKAGIMLTGDGMKPSSAGKRVRFDGSSRMVIDGPFPTRETVAGFWLWEVKDMAEAVDWLKRCPNPMPTASEVEIRPFYQIEDLADVMTPELSAQEKRLREMERDD